MLVEKQGEGFFECHLEMSTTSMKALFSKKQLVTLSSRLP
jgi:hypothetical protein